MRLTIIKRYELKGPDEHCSDYRCLDEEGNRHLVDIFVDGTIPGDTKDEDLIGKTIEVRSLMPYLEIANDVQWPPLAECRFACGKFAIDCLETCKRD